MKPQSFFAEASRLVLAMVVFGVLGAAGASCGSDASTADASTADASGSNDATASDASVSKDATASDANDACRLAPGTYVGRFTESGSLTRPELCPALADVTVSVAANQGTEFLDPGATCTAMPVPMPKPCSVWDSCVSPPDARRFTVTKLFAYTVANNVLSGTVNHIVRNETGTVMTNCHYAFGYTKS